MTLLQQHSHQIGALLLAGLVLTTAHIGAGCDASRRDFPSQGGTGVNQEQIKAAYARLPLSFEANQGQTNAQVKFLSRGSGYTLFLTANEAVLALTRMQNAEIGMGNEKSVVSSLQSRTQKSTPANPQSAFRNPQSTMLRMKLLGANPEPQMKGEEELPGKSHYFLGNDPKKWRTNIPHYRRVRYEEIYPGIDLVYYGNQRQLECDFVVALGADPKAILLDFKGADKLEVDTQGDLILQTAGSELRLRKPLIYQEVDGVRREIPGGYVLQGKGQIGFQVAAYDVGRPLVIDPQLAYSTFLGGADFDAGRGIAVDTAGNVYVTGHTASFDDPFTPQNEGFPTQNAFQPDYGGGFNDAFVTKLNAAGDTLLYSTYLGGSGEELGASIAVDTAGNAYVTGQTSSADFPTKNAFQPTFGGGGLDAFVTKLNANGDMLLYSTYLGGSGNPDPVATLNDEGWGIAVDTAGNAYVTGFTGSTDFPTQNAFQPDYGGGFNDAFVTKLNAAGDTLLYSTYLGGSNGDSGLGIAVDTAGNAYVTGGTNSADDPTTTPENEGFPTTQNAFQPDYGGYLSMAFVTKLNATGSALLYSTYLGGTFFDAGQGIAVDTAGNAYVTGRTDSTDFPTQNAFQPDHGGGFGNAFVTKLNATGSALLYSTYLGGTGFDEGRGIAVDTAGNAYVTGLTGKGFPLKDPFQFCFGGGDRDIFVAKLDPSQSGAASLVYSSYLGGIGTDYGFGIAVDTAGNAYVTGQTSSTDFPTTPGAFDHTFNGGFADAFVAKISPLSGKAGSPVAHGCGPFVGGIVPSPEPRLSVSRVELDFGLLRLGGKITKRNQSLQLMNIGDAPLTGNVGTLSDPFMVVSGGGSFTLAPAQRETVTVQFAPSGAGDFSDTLEITSNDPRRSMVDVDVEGSGFEVD